MIIIRAVLLFVFATISIQVWGVDCTSSDITLSSQSDVDNFQVDYGGGSVCDTVIGDLTINSATTYTITLDGLNGLTGVGGQLYIANNDALIDINGLANLTSVGDRVYIGYNKKLNNLDGLQNLLSANGITITRNGLLSDTQGLSGINTVNGDLRITSNYNLKMIIGLQNLTSVSGTLELSGMSVQYINPWTSLASVGDLYFNNLGYTNSPSYFDVHFLANLTSVGSIIMRASSITTLHGLENIAGLSSLQLDEMSNLENVDGLNNLKSVDGSVSIFNNRNLVNLGGLTGLNSVGGGLNVYENIDLANCADLAPVLGWPTYPHDEVEDNVGGDVVIYNNFIGALSPNDCLASYVPPNQIFSDSFEEN